MDPSSTAEYAEEEEDVMDLMKVMIKLQNELCGKKTTYKQVKFALLGSVVFYVCWDY